MGAFVLGVLVGWLAEWMFYTFWVKAGGDSEDSSAIKAELDLKNKQISSLQTQLASFSGKSLSKTSPLKEATVSSSTQKTAKQSTATKKDTASSNSPDLGSKMTTDSSSKSSSKSKANKPTAKKKSTTKQTSSSKKKVQAKQKNQTGDDFTKLTGIGPSMSATLKSLGIDTFSKLAATDDNILRGMLEESGARMNNNKEAMDSWNEQASVAARGDFKALKTMQASLKK